MTTITAEIVTPIALQGDHSQGHVPAVERLPDTDVWILNDDASYVLRCPRTDGLGYEFEVPDDIDAKVLVVKHDGFPIIEIPLEHALEKGAKVSLTPRVPIPATWFWWKG